MPSLKASQPICKRRVSLQLSVRTQNCLLAEGVDTLHKLLRLSKYDLLRLPNLGPKSATEIAEVLGLLMPAPQPTTPP